MTAQQAASTVLLGGNTVAFVKATDFILAGAQPPTIVPIIVLIAAFIGSSCSAWAYVLAGDGRDRNASMFNLMCNVSILTLATAMATVAGYAVGQYVGWL